MATLLPTLRLKGAAIPNPSSLLPSLLALIIVTSSFCYTTAVNSIPPIPAVHETFSAFGVFHVPRHHLINSSLPHLCTTSRWFQNHVNKNLRLDIGLPGEKGFSSMFFFDESQVVQIISHQDALADEPRLECVQHARSYDDEVDGYSARQLDYLGTIEGFVNETKLENGEKSKYNLYAGATGEEGASLNVILYEIVFGNGTRLYAGLDTILQPRIGGVSRYWYFDHEIGAPSEEVFNWRKFCRKSIPDAIELLKQEHHYIESNKYCAHLTGSSGGEGVDGESNEA